MARLRDGDNDASAQVFRRFTHRLVALARLHLNGRVRQKVDPEDVLQSVFKSFFLRHAQGRPDGWGWDSLWSLLAVITASKCGRCARWFHAGRRDVRAEVPEACGQHESGVILAFAADPSPAEAVMVSELVEGLLRDLGQRDGEILTLALQGHTGDEISDRLARSAQSTGCCSASRSA
jgi:RNA polymerase sigma-70 factor (ECF subfamily)